MESSSQDNPSEPSQLDVGLPEVSSTPCFVVLDSQAEDVQSKGEESTAEARTRRLKQLTELTKHPLSKPSLEMELGEQSSGNRASDTCKDEKRDKKDEGDKSSEEEQEDDEVTSTQEDLFDGVNKLPKQQDDFRSPSTSKDASHFIGTTSQDVHITPTSKDASHITGTSSQDVPATPTSKDLSHLISTPAETIGSLRFSGIVLANETSTSGSSASINVVYPSPEAYGPAPLILPSTPTRPDTSNEEPMDLSENEDVMRPTLPPAPLKRKSTNTSDESEDVYRIPAWQEELNQIQKRKEEAANTQDSWLEDNTGSKQQRSLSASIDSPNPSSELSENIHKSSAELEESLSLQQHQPMMIVSTTDESSRQSAGSRPPSTSIVGNRTKGKVSNSAPILEETGKGKLPRDTKSTSGSSLPTAMPYTAEHYLTKEQSKDLRTKDQQQDCAKPAESEMQSDDGDRLNVTKQKERLEPDIEIIDDDEEEDDVKKGADAGVGGDVDPSQDWCLRLSPSQTQTQTQYSISRREHGAKGVVSQRDLSQTKSKDLKKEMDRIEKTNELKGDGTTAASRQATPWHSTQADDAEDDDDDVSILIPESEKLDENKENDRRSFRKPLNPEAGGEKERKDGSGEKPSESADGQGMEDSVFLEGEAPMQRDVSSRLGQLEGSDNPSPIAGFHLSVPKDGALLRPLSSVTPYLGKKGQWRSDGTPRHSTPIADETETSSNRRESVPTQDTETPKTSSKSTSALMVSGVMDMDSAESSEIPEFHLRNPVDDCSDLLKEAKESPSKRQKSVFSRVREATTAAKSNPRTKKQSLPADKDPFSITKPKSKFILGRKRNQQSLQQAEQSQVATGAADQSCKEQEVAHMEEEAEDGDVRKASDVAMEAEDDEETIPLDYQRDDPDVEEPDVQVVHEEEVVMVDKDEEKEDKEEEGNKQKADITDTRQEETQQYGAKEQHQDDIEMEVEDAIQGEMKEPEDKVSKGHVSLSQDRRRDPYEFTESQSNRTPTPMKTWARKEDPVPVEKLPSRNLDKVSSVQPAAEQASTSKITPKTKKTPKGSRQARGGKRKRPQELETTEEEVETPGLNRTRTSPRKSTSTVRKAPRKRGKVLEKQQSKGEAVVAQTERPPHVVSPSLTERVVEEQPPVASERRLPRSNSSSSDLRQFSGQSPPTRQPNAPWKTVRYKKVYITQRIKEVFEWGEMVETTVVEQVINNEVIEKIEHEFTTPSPPTPRSKTSSLTSGSLADISSLGSRTSSSGTGSLQKSSSVHSMGIQKSISLSNISEVNNSLDKTISLPGSEKTSPNVSGHEHSVLGKKLSSPGGVVPERMSSRGTRASPVVSRHQDSASDAVNVSPGFVQPKGVSPRVSWRKSSPGGIHQQPDHSDHDQSSRTSRTKSPGVNLPNIQTPPPINLSEVWTAEELQQSSESEGIPCAQPRIESDRVSSDEALEKSDGEVGRQTTTTTAEESLERVDVAGPSSRNEEELSTRPTRGKRRGKAKTPDKQTVDDTQIVQGGEEGGDIDIILTAPPEESRQKVVASSSTSELTTDSAQAFLVPGVRVFTRWMDGFYYPGTIKDEEKNNKLKIAFDDGDVRNVNYKDIIIKDWLSLGQSVMAESKDGYNYPGIVIGYFRGLKPGDAGYYVETDNGQTSRYPRQKVILSKDQATLLLTSCPSSSTGISDVSLENLVEGPRQRMRSRLRAPSGEGVVRTPSKVLGKTPKRAPSPAITRSGGKRKAAEKQPEEGGVSPKKKAKQLATRLLGDVVASPDLSRQGIGLRQSPRKQRPQPSTSASPARTLTPSTPRTMEMLLGPLPSNRSLFKGMAFLLTRGEVKKRLKVMDTSTSESEMEDETDEVPYEKDYTRKQIETGGGMVLKDFDKSQRTQNKLFVISNTYCRTKKYFQALASNIPCVSNLWIRDCSRTNKLQGHKAYQLPAGETLDGDVVEWKPNRCILSGLKIFVMSVHYEVENTWRSILMAAGCYIVAKFPTINELSRGGIPFDCNVVVTDPTCPRHILHRAQQLDIPVVSVEWVMQSLINGVRMPYASHYKFSWDYKEK